MLLGLGTPLFDALAALVVPATVVAAAIAGVAYGLSYRRSVLDVFEAQERPAARPGRVARWAEGVVNGRLLGNAGERAFAFVWHTVMRSRQPAAGCSGRRGADGGPRSGTIASGSIGGQRAGRFRLCCRCS